MHPGKYRKHISSTTRYKIDDVRQTSTYNPRPVILGRQPKHESVQKPQIVDTSNGVPLASNKVFGFMGQSYGTSAVARGDIKNKLNSPIIQETRLENLKNKLSEFKYWRELRFFLSGAALSLGIACLAYYGFVDRPVSFAESETLPKVQVNSDGTQTHIIEGGEAVNVSPGVDINSIDRRPPRKIEPDMPAKLIVPKIRVNANIRSLGLAKDGSLAVPNYYNQVGWFEQSSRPGSPGTVVLDGHYEAGNVATVFNKIDSVTPGDVIQIVRGDGQVVEYKVEVKEVYDKNKVPMEKIIGGDGKERVHIVTCFGDWLPKENTYSKRLALYAIRTN